MTKCVEVVSVFSYRVACCRAHRRSSYDACNRQCSWTTNLVALHTSVLQCQPFLHRGMPPHLYVSVNRTFRCEYGTWHSDLVTYHIIRCKREQAQLIVVKPIPNLSCTCAKIHSKILHNWVHWKKAWYFRVAWEITKRTEGWNILRRCAWRVS